MAQLNPVLQAYFLYLNARGLKNTANRLKQTFINEKDTLEEQSEQRTEEAKHLHRLWDLYRTGNIKESRTQQLRTAAGAALSGASAFQRAMSTNYMLTSIPMSLAYLTHNSIGFLNRMGVHSNLMNSIGASAAHFAASMAPIANFFRYAQYVNPVYAASSIATSKLMGMLQGVIGTNPFLMTMLTPYALMLAYPFINKITGKITSLIAGGSISKKHQIKLKPLSINTKLYGASDFINKRPIQEANELINQLYALDPDQKTIEPVQIAQLQYLAEIAAYTSSLPILTAEFVNKFIKKEATPALIYNRNLSKLETYYRGKEYREVIEKHADRLEHGKFAHTITENIGLAATEFSSFLHKLSIMLDPIKQIQMVASGKNIKDEINKFNKAFQTIEQRKSAIFVKKMGIGEEESYVNMYFSLTEDSQAILSRAKSFEDAQIGLLAGIYEFTRLTALETATLRTKAYGIKEPVKYNVIGSVDSEAKGLLDWLSNKIPMFEFIRMIASGSLNIARIMVDKLLPDKGTGGKLKNAIQFIIGKPRVFRYHDEYLNRLVEGFDLRRETTLLERIAEPFIDKLNEAILKIPILRIFGNENRMKLKERAELKYQEKMAKGIDAILKEMGFEKLEDQQLYYRYATSTMPEQFDLMIHHLSNIALFTHSIMLNTAALSKVLAGSASIAKANRLVRRSINRYTGRLETAEEAIEFQMSMLKAVGIKVGENLRENKKSIFSLLDTLRYIITGKYSKGIEQERIFEGVIEAFYELFKREKNTAEEIWGYMSEMMYRPLFARELLEEIKDNKELAKIIMNKEINKEYLLRSKGKYGLTDFDKNQLVKLESQMLKVDIARVSAPELLKFMGYKVKDISNVIPPKLEPPKKSSNIIYANEIFEKMENFINEEKKTVENDKTAQNDEIKEAIIKSINEMTIKYIKEKEENRYILRTLKFVNNKTTRLLDKVADILMTTDLPENAVAKFSRRARITSSILMKKVIDKFAESSFLENLESKDKIIDILRKANRKIALSDTPDKILSKLTKVSRITSSILLSNTSDILKMIEEGNSPSIILSKLINKVATSLSATELPENFAKKFSKTSRYFISSLLKKGVEKFADSRLLENSPLKNKIVNVIENLGSKLTEFEILDNMVADTMKHGRKFSSYLLRHFSNFVKSPADYAPRIILSKLLNKVGTGLKSTEMPELLLSEIVRKTRTTSASLLKKAASKITTTDLFQNEEAKTAISEILEKFGDKLAATEAPEKFIELFTRKSRRLSSILLRKAAKKLMKTEKPQTDEEEKKDSAIIKTANETVTIKSVTDTETKTATKTAVNNISNIKDIFKEVLNKNAAKQANNEFYTKNKKTTNYVYGNLALRPFEDTEVDESQYQNTNAKRFPFKKTGLCIEAFNPTIKIYAGTKKLSSFKIQTFEKIIENVNKLFEKEKLEKFSSVSIKTIKTVSFMISKLIQNMATHLSESNTVKHIKNVALKTGKTLYLKSIAGAKKSITAFNEIIDDIYTYYIGKNNSDNIIPPQPVLALSEQLGINTPILYLNRSKISPFFRNQSADNTIEGIEEAHKIKIINLEEEQTERLTGIEKILSDIKKLLSIQHIINEKNKRSRDIDTDDDEESGGLLDWLMDRNNKKSNPKEKPKNKKTTTGKFSKWFDKLKRIGGPIFKKASGIIGGIAGRSILDGLGSTLLGDVGGVILGGLGSALLGEVGNVFLGDVGETILGEVGGALLGDVGIGALTELGSAAAGLLASPVGLAIAGTAAASALGYGLYNANYGREKTLIDKLEQSGIVEHSFFGDSKILNWESVRKLPLEQLTQLLAFDDWSDEDKKALQKLVYQKTKEKTILDKQRENIFKNQEEFNKFIEQRDKEMQEKEGTFGHWLDNATKFITHSIGNILSFGGMLGLGNSDDRDLYEKLEDAGVIRYSILPYIESEVRDWDTITKLNTDQLKSLLRLNWDIETKKHLREILKIRKEQKNSKNNTIDNLKNSVKNVFSNIKKIANNAISYTSKEIHNFFNAGNIDNLLSDLSNKGIITKTPQGIKITDWDKIYSLSIDKIKSLIQYSDFIDANAIKQKLQTIYNIKISKQITDKLNSKNIPNPMNSKVDLDTVVNTSTNQHSVFDYIGELFETLTSKIDELIAVTAAGHAKQVAATLQIAKNQNNNDDNPNHPLIDN